MRKLLNLISFGFHTKYLIFGFGYHLSYTFGLTFVIRNYFILEINKSSSGHHYCLFQLYLKLPIIYCLASGYSTYTTTSEVEHCLILFNQRKEWVTHESRLDEASQRGEKEF